MDHIYDKLDKHKRVYNKEYCDCLITYECNDNKGEFLCHRHMLANSPYFESIFKYNQPEFVNIDNAYLNKYALKLPFNVKSLMTYFILLYEEEKEISIDIDYLDDLLNTIDYLLLDKVYLVDIIQKILDIVITDNKLEYIFILLENRTLNTEYKSAFISRTYYLLNEIQKKEINLSSLEVSYLYETQSYYDSNKNRIIISKAQPEFTHDGLDYSIYNTSAYCDGDSYGYWISVKPENEDIRYNRETHIYEGEVTVEKKTKCHIGLVIFDGVDKPKLMRIAHKTGYGSVKNYEMSVPCEVEYREKRARYGKIEYGTEREHQTYMFIVEFDF